MYPFVWEIYLNTIYIINLLIFVDLLHFKKYSIYICFRGKVNSILSYCILRIPLLKFAHLFTLMSKMAQEESYTYQCITSVMRLWIDDTTITFTTNNSICLLHLCDYVHLTYSSSIILHTIFACYITKCSC